MRLGLVGKVRLEMVRLGFSLVWLILLFEKMAGKIPSGEKS